VAPEFPPATTYGSTMFRNDDPRSLYQPYHAIPLDATAPPEILLQSLWLREGQLGAYSPELVPELRNLGAAYFADGEYPDAIETFGRAIHLLRVNEGLNTHAQTGMVEQVIEAYIAMGDFIAADDQHEYLYRIRRANLSPGDPEMLAAVEQYADWHRAAYLGQLDRYRYPRIVDLFDLYGEMADAVEEESGGLSRAMLHYLEGKFRSEYMLSVYPGEKEEGLQVEASQRDDIDLPDLTKLRFSAFRKDNYRNGLRSIRSMEEVIEQSPDGTPRELADIRVRLGDWYQWHRRYAQAISAYEDAWAMMADQPDGEQWLKATFSVPLELPSQVIFQPGRMPLRLYHAAEVRARFVVSRHGEAEEIEILSPGSEENQPAVTRGFKYLRDMRFRPRLEGGEVVASGGVERIYNIRY
jgi:tetratricopeptide (TPR) repeat protein